MGKKWELTGEGIESEHILTECIVGQMKQVSDQLIAPVNMRPVLLASAQDDLHTIPQYVAAAALAERRIGSRTLGARVPYTSLLSAMKKLAPAAVLIWGQVPVKTLPPEFSELINARPTPLLFIFMCGLSVFKVLGWASKSNNSKLRAHKFNDRNCSTLCTIWF